MFWLTLRQYVQEVASGGAGSEEDDEVGSERGAQPRTLSAALQPLTVAVQATSRVTPVAPVLPVPPIPPVPPTAPVPAPRSHIPPAKSIQIAGKPMPPSSAPTSVLDKSVKPSHTPKKTAPSADKPVAVGVDGAQDLGEKIKFFI